MDVARWQKIEEVFNATLELPADERPAFVASTCGDDRDLRAEIEALLIEVHQSENFLSESSFSLGAQLLSNESFESLAGQTIGTYTIVRRLGRGGMGEVYLAHDERLGRKVAIKLLPKRLIEDDERIRRFKHEARAASAISHPNVAHVYEIGESEGRFFTAMEFVNGVTLRERFARGPLKLGEVIDIATQVSLAISAAHAQGIIHRDIKPENIMIRPDGLVKVVDFGLAKLSEPPRERASPNSRETQLVARITGLIHTEPGLLLGTATYMSPEQARGQETDARTDIWSWGVVFYEMLTGEPPFNGATNSDIIAEILKSEPSFAHPIFNSLPESATSIARRALSKDRFLRYGDISEVIAALREFRREAEAGKLLDVHVTSGQNPDPAAASQAALLDAKLPLSRAATVTATSLSSEAAAARSPAAKSSTHRFSTRGRKFLIFSAATLVLGTFAILLLARSGFIFRKAPSRASLEIVHLTNDGRVMDAAISPDGRLLAFVPIQSGKQSLRVRDLASGENWELQPPDPALCWGLRFTPSSEQLFFVTTQPGSTISVLYRMPVRGGAAQKIVVNIDSPPGLSPDGMQIAFVRGYPGQHRDALIIANVDGSAEKEILSRAHPDKFSFSGVAWSPDNKLIALGAMRANETELAVLGIPSNGGPAIELTPWKWSAVRGLAWENDGRTLLFCAQPAGTNALQIWRLSYPEKVISPVTSDKREYEEITLGQNVLSATDTYEVADLWSLRPGDSPRQLTTDGHNGADGLAATTLGRVVYTVGENEQSHLWSMNPDGSDRKPLVMNTAFLPSASKDGRIAYVSREGGAHHIWMVDIDGQNNRQLTFGDGESYPSITPDGGVVVYISRAKERGTIWRISAQGGPPVQITFAGIILRPVVSPDRTKIACTFRTDESDRWKIAILPFDGGEPLQTFALPYPYNQIIRWTPDSRAITYLDKVNGVHNLWRQPIDGSAPTQITNFDSDLIMQYGWLTPEELIMARGGRRRDIVLLRNFDAGRPAS
jgi:serine/threonine protein kinase/Tol biopolymer transport system component